MQLEHREHLSQMWNHNQSLGELRLIASLEFIKYKWTLTFVYIGFQNIRVEARKKMEKKKFG